MINKVILLGNVGADPEIRTLEGGVKVARVRLATTERIFNRSTQETKEHTEWHSITLWRGLADVADRFVKKGSQIYIEGRLRSRDWTDESGAKRYAVEVVADDMKLLGRREGGSAGSAGSAGSHDGGSPAGGYNSGASNPSAPHGGSSASAAATPQPSAPSVPQEDPDDLPF